MLFNSNIGVLFSLLLAQLGHSLQLEEQRVFSYNLSESYLPVSNPTKSFWIDSPNANPLAGEGSDGPLTPEADICIIGSGTTGVSTAYHLAELLDEGSSDPLKVVILEARDFCSGATGRNGGHLTPRAFLEFNTYAQLYGEQEAMKSLAIEHHTASSIVEFIKSTNRTADVDLIEGGHINILFTEQSEVDARADYEAARAAGADLHGVQWMSKEHMFIKFGTSHPGVRFPAHNLWPLKFVTGLYNTTKLNKSKVSLNIHTRTPVTSMSPLDHESTGPLPRRWNLTTPRGALSCSYVVHATNGYASHLLPHLRGSEGIVPTRGQIIAIRANASAAQLTKASWSSSPSSEYWFPRPIERSENPLVILGGGRELTGPRYERFMIDDASLNPVVGKTLRQFLPGVFPGKFDVARVPEMEWSGIMGYTSSGDPFVGPVGDGYDGQYISAGYSGHGMPRAFACGEAIAQMLVSNITGQTWTVPEWLPQRYLTWNRT